MNSRTFCIVACTFAIVVSAAINWLIGLSWAIEDNPLIGGYIGMLSAPVLSIFSTVAGYVLAKVDSNV